MLRTLLLLVIQSHFLLGTASAQEQNHLFPPRSLMPELLAGPRDPRTSATLLGVLKNPSRHGHGVEAEVSIGSAFPVFLLAGTVDDSPIVVGIEAAAFARFALQVLEREMVATDWVFAVPVIWHRQEGWVRFGYYHTSSHMGDEYSRRFEDPGINFSRDEAEILYFRGVSNRRGVFGGVRYAYNVHPQESKRWVLRFGGQWERPEPDANLRPFLATDVEWDQEEGGRPRVELRAGAGMEKVGVLQKLRVALTLLTGPSPLGQFNGKSTTQVGLTIQRRF